MYLRETATGDLVEVVEMAALTDPNVHMVSGRYHAGEEMQEVQIFAKEALQFPSGESLPRCWLDVGYKGQKPE